MEKNANCILCTECVKTCHRNNISFNLRSFAGYLFTLTKTRMDEALFILMLLGVILFQTLVMIRPWAGLTRDLMIDTGVGYDSVRFILFITAAVFPILIYSIAISISKLLNHRIMFKDLFTNYAYSIIPLGLMMHLSHNIRHLLEEGTGIIPVLSDPFGFGWDLFGTSRYMPAPLLGSNGRGNYSANIPLLIFVLIFFVFNL